MTERTKIALYQVGALITGLLVGVASTIAVAWAVASGKPTTQTTTPVAEPTKMLRRAYDPNSNISFTNETDNWLYWYKADTGRTGQLAPHASTSNMHLNQNDYFYMETPDEDRVGFKIETEGETSYAGSKAFFGDLEPSLYSNSLYFYEADYSVTLDVRGMSPYFNYYKQGGTQCLYDIAITTETYAEGGQYIVKKVPMHEVSTIRLIELDELANFGSPAYRFYICDEEALLNDAESFRTARTLNLYVNNSENAYTYGDFAWQSHANETLLVTQTRNAKYFTNNLSFQVNVGISMPNDIYPTNMTCEMNQYSTATDYYAEYAFTIETNDRKYNSHKIRSNESQTGYLHHLQLATNYDIEAILTDENTLVGVFGLIGTAFTSLMPVLNLEIMGFPLLTILLIPLTFGLIVMIVKLIKK